MTAGRILEARRRMSARGEGRPEWRALALLTLVLSLAAAGTDAAAQGTPGTFTVTSLSDGFDTTNNVGVYTSGTLRWAVQQANQYYRDTTQAATIDFNVSSGGTINLVRMLPVWTNAAGITIDGTNGGQGSITINGGTPSIGTVGTDAVYGDRIFFVGILSATDTPAAAGVSVAERMPTKKIRSPYTASVPTVPMEGVPPLMVIDPWPPFVPSIVMPAALVHTGSIRTRLIVPPLDTLKSMVAACVVSR